MEKQNVARGLTGKAVGIIILLALAALIALFYGLDVGSVVS